MGGAEGTVEEDGAILGSGGGGRGGSGAKWRGSGTAGWLQGQAAADQGEAQQMIMDDGNPTWKGGLTHL